MPMKILLRNVCTVMMVYLCIVENLFAMNNHSNNNDKIMEKKLNLTQQWDKTFPQSNKVNHTKITFHNRYGITLAADLYIPKNTMGKLPAVAVSGPFGAVKEQASGFVCTNFSRTWIPDNCF